MIHLCGRLLCRHLSVKTRFWKTNWHLGNNKILTSSFLSFWTWSAQTLQKFFKIVFCVQNTRCQNDNCYSRTVKQDTRQIFIRPNIEIQECVNAYVDFKENRKYKCEKCSQVNWMFSMYVFYPTRVLMLLIELFDNLTIQLYNSSGRNHSFV